MKDLWFALLEDKGDVADSMVLTHVRDADADAGPAGWLALWLGSGRPHPQAVQADPRLHDPQGPACVVALALAAPHARPIADDPAVVHARRRVLRDGRPRAVTMLTADPVSIAGALTVARADRPEEVAALRDDPFGVLWESRQLHVAAGVFGSRVQPTGPCVERYAGRPWPYDRF